MTLFSFCFAPVFFSVLACLFFLHGNTDLHKKKLQIFILILISVSVCFAYPLSNVYISGRYEIFDDFFLFCFLSSLISMFINLMIFIIKSINGSSSNKGN